MPSLKLKLEFPADANANINKSLAIAFICDEGVNRLYHLTVLLAIPASLTPKVGDFLGQTLALEAKWEFASGEMEYDIQASATESAMKCASATHRVFYAQVHDCTNLGDSGEHATDSGERLVYRFFLLDAGPKARNMTASTSSRVYITSTEDSSDEKTIKPSDAVAKLLTAWDGKVKHSFMKDNEDKTYQPTFNHPLPFIVQYRENDYDFLLRWVERQGWHFIFKFFSDAGQFRDGNGRLAYHEEVLAINEKAAFIPLGVGKSQYTNMAKSAPSNLGLYSLRERLGSVPSQVTAHDYTTKLSQKELTVRYPVSPEDTGMPPLHLDDEFFADTEEGNKLVQTRMEGLKSVARFFTGTANLPGFAPGRAFLLRGDGSGTRNNDPKWLTESHFILTARHSAAAADLAADLNITPRDIWDEFPEVGYRVNFQSIKYASVDTYHPPRTTRWPRIAGTVTAFTVPLSNLENYAVAVTGQGSYHLWLEGVEPMPKTAGKDGSIGPVRSLVPGVGVNSTDSAPLNAGTEVVVSFDHGNPDRPLIVGAGKNNHSLSRHPYNATVFQRENGSQFTSALDRNIDLWTISSPGGNPFLDAISDYSSTYLTHNTTFYNSNARLYSSRMGGFATNANTFYNSVSAGRDILTTLGKVGSALFSTITKSLKVSKVDIPLLASSTEKISAPMSNGPTQFLFSVLTLLSMSEQKERLLLSSSEGTASLGTRGFFPKTSGTTKANLGLVITNLALDMINETLGVVESVNNRKAEYEKQENDYDSTENPDSIKRWRPLPIDRNLLKTIPDLAANALVYTKLIYAICAQNDDSTGIRVSAIRSSSDGIGKMIKDKVIAMLLPTPPILGRQDNGMTLVVESDGQTTHLSDEGINLLVHPKATLKAKPTAPEQVAILNISGPNRPASTTSTDPTQPAKPNASRIGMEANVIALRAVADVHLTAKKNLTMGVGLKIAEQTPGDVDARLALTESGECHLDGAGTGSMAFKKCLGLSAQQTLFLHGKHVVVGADTGGGLIFGLVDANGLAKNEPCIRLKAAKNQGAQTWNNYQNLFKTRRDLMKAQAEYQRVEREIERLCYIKRANPTNAIAYGQAQAELATHIPNLATAKTKLQAAVTAEAQAKAKVAAENLSGTKKLELVNGTDESEKVTLEQKNVRVESVNGILLKVSDTKLSVSQTNMDIYAKGTCKINAKTISLG